MMQAKIKKHEDMLATLFLTLWLGVTPLRFAQLTEVQTPQEVQVRGFLYRTSDERWILAEESQLKSCCVGAPHLKDRQVTLLGDHFDAPIGFAVTVEGTLIHDQSFFSLKNPRLISSNYRIPFALAFLGIGGIFIIYLRKKRYGTMVKKTRDDPSTP